MWIRVLENKGETFERKTHFKIQPIFSKIDITSIFTEYEKSFLDK